MSSRVLELSQSVDRFIDHNGHGFVSCLTPTGFQFVSTRGGLLSGREALALQGLPIQQLLLTKESQKDLFDLAGNAMTTTVVGAAILAALIVAHEAIPMIGRQAANQDLLTALAPPDMSHQLLTFDQNLDLTGYDKALIKRLWDTAQQSIQLCSCEGQTLVATRSFSRCTACGHSACENCAGIPTHNYIDIPRVVLNDRKDPSAFKNLLRDCLPMRLQLSGLGTTELNLIRIRNNDLLDSALWDEYQKAITPGLGEEMRFHSVKRSWRWIVKYDAPHSYLELMIGNEVLWQLFAKPDSKAPNNSRTRALLKYPFAQMKISAGRLNSGDDILAGEWKFFLPGSVEFPLMIAGGGEKTKAWESKLGLQKADVVHKEVWTELQISNVNPAPEGFESAVNAIVGTYTLLGDCGTACGSLHKRLVPAEAFSTYFFLDPERIGEKEKDEFVFSKDHHRLSYLETRDSIASLQGGWRTDDSDQNIVNCKIRGVWRPCGAMLQPFEGPGKPTCAVPETNVQVSVLGGSTLQDMTRLSQEDYRCSTATLALVSFKVPLAAVETHGWKQGPWSKVDQVDERLTFQMFAWLLERIKSLYGFATRWRSLKLPNDFVRCQSCAPKAPDIRWRLQKQGGTKVVPYEDDQQAGAYERALKSRADPFVTRTRIDENNCGCLMIGLNISTLVHRAVAKLSGVSCSDMVQISWRLTTQYDWHSQTKFENFKLGSNTNESEYNHVFEARKLSRKRLVTYQSGELRKEQKRSLQWMINQESKNVQPFLEQEIEEAHLPHLGWLAEVIAQKNSCVRGGVLADEVGYGKTATILALIDATHAEASQPPQAPLEGRIFLKATLIVVPKTIVLQWEGQIHKFLGSKYVVRVIKTINDLLRLTIKDFESADMVLISSATLRTDSYADIICKFAAVPACSSTSGRAYTTWLNQAISRMEQHADELRSTSDVPGFAKVLKERLKSANEDEELLRSIPTKRLRGAAYARKAQTGNAQKLNSGTKGCSLPTRHVEPYDEHGKAAETAVATDPSEIECQVEDDMDDELESEVDPDDKDYETEDNIDDGLESDSDPSDDESEMEYNIADELKANLNRDSVDIPNANEEPRINKITKETDRFKLNVCKKWSDMRAPPLHIFTFHRLVVDEYTYLEEQDLACLTSLKARNRWILSGTPQTADFADIKFMAGFIGVNLGVDDDSGNYLQPQNIRKIRDRRTGIERSTF